MIITEAKQQLQTQLQLLSSISSTEKTNDETIQMVGSLFYVEYLKTVRELKQSKLLINNSIVELLTINNNVSNEILFEYERILDDLASESSNYIIPSRFNLDDLLSIRPLINLNSMMEMIFPPTILEKLNLAESIISSVDEETETIDSAIAHATDLNFALQMPQDIKIEMYLKITEAKNNCIKNINIDFFNLVNTIKTFEENLFTFQVPILISKLVILETILLNDSLFNFSRENLIVNPDDAIQKIGSVYFTDELYITDTGTILYNRLITSSDKLAVLKRVRDKYSKFISPITE